MNFQRIFQFALKALYVKKKIVDKNNFTLISQLWLKDFKKKKIKKYRNIVEGCNLLFGLPEKKSKN